MNEHQIQRAGELWLMGYNSFEIARAIFQNATSEALVYSSLIRIQARARFIRANPEQHNLRLAIQ
jgi:hypothetical protein